MLITYGNAVRAEETAEHRDDVQKRLEMTKGIDIAMALLPEIMYTLQGMFICLDMVSIKK